jgi:Sigma-70, region 4
MTPRIDEVAPDLYRISVYVPQFDLQFNHFLVRDDEPLLFHTGMRGMFPAVREAVAALIPPESLRWISWSHSVDLKRRDRRRERLLETFSAPSWSDPHDGAALDADRLESCLGRLGERERMVVLLTFYAERSARHVADELTMTEGNVRVIRPRRRRDPVGGTR